MERIIWSKKLFSILLEKARGERSWKEFSADCGVSYVQLRKLVLCQQENPPRPKLMRKLAASAEGGVELSDFFFTAGLSPHDTQGIEAPGATLPEKYRKLVPRDRKTVNRFIDFLLRDRADDAEEDDFGD